MPGHRFFIAGTLGFIDSAAWIIADGQDWFADTVPGHLQYAGLLAYIRRPAELLLSRKQGC
jgi:hypothetical protein